MKPQQIQQHARDTALYLLASWIFDDYEPNGDEEAALEKPETFNKLSADVKAGFVKQAELQTTKPLEQWSPALVKRLVASIMNKTWISRSESNPTRRTNATLRKTGEVSGVQPSNIV